MLLPFFSLNEPIPHILHSNSFFKPISSEYLPASQSLHCEGELKPGTSEYLPTPHRPLQSFDFIKPISIEYFPVSHSLHSSSPGLSLYCPALHFLHPGIVVVFESFNWPPYSVP